MGRANDRRTVDGFTPRGTGKTFDQQFKPFDSPTFQAKPKRPAYLKRNVGRSAPRGVE
jgi:hypothetical protein